MSGKERIPLKKGMELELRAADSKGNYYVQQAVVEAYIGSGATCLSYIVKINRDGTNYARMVMKEFYPSGDTFLIDRIENRLKIAEETKNDKNFQEEKENFRNSFALQNRLAGSEAMEIMVKPYLMAEYGDSLYLLSEMHLGEVLSFAKITGLSDKLWLVYRTAEAIALLHEQGYLYMDLNPKNILWIPSQKAVKLFDVDSMIPYQKPDEVAEIRVTKAYAAPELKELENWFEVNRHAFLKPSWDVYGLGLLLFEQLFDRLPTEEDLETGFGRKEEAEEICWRAGCQEPEICEKLKEILCRSLSRSFRIRYGSARKFCEEVNELKKRLDAQPFIPKREYAKANEKISAYYLLDQHPLYEFARQESGRQILDAALIGNHPIRKELVKAIFSCAHMWDSVLRIRLYGQDSESFLDGLEEENPALAKTTRVFRGDACIRDRWDPLICARPVAEFYLYRQPEDIRRCPSGYVLVLEENREKCRNILSMLGDCGEGSGLLPDQSDCRHIFAQGTGGAQRRFLAGLENMADMPEFAAFIPVRPKCSGYDEELIRTEFLQRAMNVHAVYSREKNRRITKKEIRESFQADIYSMESSLRSALAVKYKLASAGIDPSDQNMAKNFCSRVLSDTNEARNLFEKLSDLEHFSWSAHMIINGWDLPDSDQIEKYAFENGNDFKERKKKLHPCLRESRPGNRIAGLKREDWEREEMCRDSSLDGLEQTTIFLHQIAGKKAQTAKADVRCLMDRLTLRMQQPSEGVRESLASAKMALEQIFLGKSGGEDTWKSAKEAFLAGCRENGVYLPGINSCMREIEEKRKVISEYNAFRDYKKPDEIIIRNIPVILTDGKIGTVEVTWESGKSNRWKNVLSALYLEPEHLVFLSDRKKSVDVNFYRDFLKKCGRETDVSVKSIKTGQSSIVSEGQKPCRGADKTGSSLTPEEMENAYGRELCLTVEEALILRGTDLMQRGTEKPVYPPVSVLYSIWDACRKCRDGWNVLTKILKKEEKRNIRILPAVGAGEKEEEQPFTSETVGADVWKKYTTDYIYGSALRVTGVDSLMRKLQELREIKDFELPGEEEELPVRFMAVSEETAKILKDIIETSGREPFRHRYRLEMSDIAVQRKHKSPVRSIRDETNHVCGEVLLNKRVGQGKKAADLLLECLEEFWERGGGQEGRQQIIQNLKMQKTDGKLTFSFKYATSAVKACLIQEYAAAEKMLFYACRNLGCFDDLGTLSEFAGRVCSSGLFSELTGREKNGILAVKGRRLYCFSLEKKDGIKEVCAELKSAVSCFGEDGIRENRKKLSDMDMEKLERCIEEMMLE